MTVPTNNEDALLNESAEIISVGAVLRYPSASSRGRVFLALADRIRDALEDVYADIGATTDAPTLAANAANGVEAGVTSAILAARRLPVSVDNAELIEEALDESTFGPGSDYDSACYWANLARKLARALSASQPREVEAAPSDTEREALEQATLYGYQAVWNDGKFDADPAKNAWMWERVQIAVKAAVERAARTSHPVQVEVTDDMVERAATAVYEVVGKSASSWPAWGEIAESHRGQYRAEARAALMAALGGGE